jgi:peroxiredoxin
MDDEIPDERPQRRREYSGAGSTLGVAAIVILVVGLATWFFEFRDDSGAAGEAGLGITELALGQNSTGRAPAAEQGRTAPNFRLAAPDGATSSLTDYRGKYVLLNFWASWCGPCRGEAPDLQALYERTKASKLVVLGVNQQEGAGEAQAFASEFGVTYPIVLDRSGGVSEAYRVGRGLPVSFLLSPDGVIVKILVGRVSADDLAKLEQEYLS